VTAFRPARWLPGAHLQTIVGHRLKGGAAPARRERWDTPDGDFLDIDWFDQGLPADAPTVLLIHGLGGSSASSYIQLSAQLLRARGVRPVAMNCRGATGPNRTMRLHHAGEWEDPAFVAARLR
jgi:predicted alpha/beta-fold hydrolase